MKKSKILSLLMALVLIVTCISSPVAASTYAEENIPDLESIKVTPSGNPYIEEMPSVQRFLYEKTPGNAPSPRAWVLGTVTMRAYRLNNNYFEFIVEINVINTTISKAYIDLDFGDGYSSKSSSHPAGISSFTKLGAIHNYTRKGTWYPYLDNIEVYCLNGAVAYDMGSFGVGSIKIT